MIFIVPSSLQTVRDTVQYRYCTFSLLYRLLRIRLEVRIPYFRTYEREKVHCKCTKQCTVHFIVILFNVGNVLTVRNLSMKLYRIYVCYTNIMLHDVIYSVRYYRRFSAVGL
jgi:hypothetical protein